MNRQYDDIIDHPHHVSKKHPRMPMRDRAAQFSPFAALVGYEDAICETIRHTEERRELDEQELVELDRCLVSLKAKIAEHPEVCIEYFVPDKHKTGGVYLTVCGAVKNISALEQTISLQDGPTIRISDILMIHCDQDLDD